MERRLTFTAYDAGEPGSPAWTERARERWPQVTPLLIGATWTPEGQAAAMDMFAEHMSELIPVLDALTVALDQPGGAACLTTVTLKPFFEWDLALSVYIGPDMAVARAEDVCVTNHQHAAVSDEQERDTRTRERLAAIRAAKAQADAGLAPDPVETIVQALLKPPLFQFDPDSGHGTLYTAACRPAEGRVSYIWPAERWEQSFADFRPGIRTINGSGAVG